MFITYLPLQSECATDIYNIEYFFTCNLPHVTLRNDLFPFFFILYLCSTYTDLVLSKSFNLYTLRHYIVYTFPRITCAPL